MQDEVGVEVAARGHDHTVAVFEGFDELMLPVMAPPHDDCLAGRYACIGYLVPSDHRLAFGGHDLAYVVLRIECGRSFRIVPVAFGALGRQQRLALDPDAPARLVGQMPVEHVEAPLSQTR